MPKATPKAPASKGKSQLISSFFQKKPKSEAKDPDDDDFQEPTSSKVKVVVPETKVQDKEKTEPKEKPKSKEQPKPKEQPKTKAATEKHKPKTIQLSDSESDYEQDRKSKPKSIQISDSESDYEEEAPVAEKKKPAPAKKPAKKEESASKVKPAAKADKEEASSSKEVKKPTKAQGFYAMKSRPPPNALGSRPEPVGQPNCLAGFTFVISGQYETLTKEKTEDIIKRYGGRITGAVSGKTTYLLRGRDAGESKTKKAEKLGTKILEEDDFYKLVDNAKEKEEVETLPPPKPKGKKRLAEEEPMEEKEAPALDTLLWTEKYKPKNTSEIIGNKETIKKISTWAAEWKDNFKREFAGNDEFASKRALLISGPPGIGKSTTAGLVAKENGFEPVEFNASDVRSKKVLEQNLTEMIDNRSVTEFFHAASADTHSAKKQKTETKAIKSPLSKKVLLIMDEVDGMSSGDRGGAVELASLIKKTKIPIICICNDVRSQKVAPLLKVCADVRFKRTPAKQILSRMMSIAFKEKLGIQPNAIEELVSATQNDIRQVINILSTYRLSRDKMNYDDAKKIGKSNQKSSQIGLFEIPGALLSGGAWRDKTLEEKSEIYFYDYDRADMMIAENYIKSTPFKAASMTKTGNPQEKAVLELELLAKASEAIAEGDYISAQIHGTVQQYSLMPVHSIMSCVRPASFAYGALKGRVDFPAWLGQNSKTTKYTKLLNEIQARMSRHSSADRFETREYYIPVLSARIFNALEEEDYDTAIQLMDEYELDRENIETISDLQLPSSLKTPLSKLPTSVKSTFTRKYNSQHHDTIFHDGGAAIKKSTSGPKEDLVGTIVAEEEPEAPEEEKVDELEELKKSKDLKVVTRKKGDAVTKKRKATSAAGSSSKKKTKK